MTPKKTVAGTALAVHPGLIVRDVLEQHRLTVTAGAKALGVARPTLSKLLNGQADLSGDMALRIEKAFGLPMDGLMRAQMAHDIELTRKRASSIKVRRYEAA